MKPAAHRLSYSERLKRRGKRFHLDMRPKQWCDLWHTHFDWDGAGDKRWIDRRRHLTALFTAMARARKELAGWGKPHQLFAQVYPKDSANDALYVHTPNPNGTSFPLIHDGARKLSTLPRLLLGKVSETKYAVYAVGSGDDLYFLVTPHET
jgi:hypothetical protein